MPGPQQLPLRTRVLCRCVQAAGGLEQRLRKCLELADGYARVLSMIEVRSGAGGRGGQLHCPVHC